MFNLEKHLTFFSYKLKTKVWFFFSPMIFIAVITHGFWFAIKWSPSLRRPGDSPSVKIFPISNSSELLELILIYCNNFIQKFFFQILDNVGIVSRAKRAKETKTPKSSRPEPCRCWLYKLGGETMASKSAKVFGTKMARFEYARGWQIEY